MRYSSSDLINRAKDLANVSNTDFLTHNEAERYLNDAYMECYQISINRGDDSFVKEMKIYGQKTPLPKDFYSLRCVKGTNGYLYKRATFDTLESEPSYNIINNHLIVTGIRSDISATYYPTPRHLTIQEKAKKTDIVSNFDIADVSDNYVIGYKKTVTTEPNPNYDPDVSLDVNPNNTENIEVETRTLYLTDLKNNNVMTKELDIDVEKLYMSIDSFWVKTVDKYILFSLDFSLLKELDIDNFIMVRLPNGLTTNAVYENNTLTWRNKEYVLEMENDLSDNVIVIADENIYYTDTDKIYWKNEKETVCLDDVDNSILIFYKDVDKEPGILYFNNNPKIFSLGFDKDETIQNIDCDFLSILGFSSSYVFYSNGVNIFTIGNTPDVVLNYPNASYYTLIAYTIATYIIAKQQGDVTLLAAQKEKALMDYYDCISDDFNVVRIKNIYT